MIMKKLLLLFPLLLSCLWGIAADEFRVAELRCEYRDNPLAINTLTPQFSWQTLSVGRGFLQAGYQIQVAPTPPTWPGAGSCCGTNNANPMFHCMCAMPGGR